MHMEITGNDQDHFNRTGTVNWEREDPVQVDRVFVCRFYAASVRP